MHVEIDIMKFWCELEKEQEEDDWILIVLIMVQHLIDFRFIIRHNSGLICMILQDKRYEIEWKMVLLIALGFFDIAINSYIQYLSK